MGNHKRIYGNGIFVTHLNAKELILSKLNATTNLADIYTYLFSLGCSAEEIGEIMTSPEFSYIAKLADGDLFGTMGMSIDKAISLYLTNSPIRGIDPNLYNLAFGTYAAGVDVWTSRKTTIEKLQNISEIDKAIAFVIEKLTTTQRVAGEYDEFDEGMYGLDEMFEGERPVTVRDFAKNKASRKEWEALLNALFTHKEVLTARMEFHKDRRDMDGKLNMILTEVLPGVEEQKILGAAAGINTGLKTKSFDKYKWARRIENYVNQRFPYDPRNPDTIANAIPFNFRDFLTDDEYQRTWIEKMETMKIADNILKVITTVPHYRAMLEAWRLDISMLSRSSRRFVLERELAESVKPTRTYNLSELEWKQIQRFVNDTFIYNWIVSSGLSFEIPQGVDFEVYSATQETIVPADRVVKMNTPEGIASFKKFMEEYIIPKLKESAKYEKNPFIQALDLTAFETKGVITSFYKLPLPMMDLDKSPTLEARYAMYLTSFNDISQDTFNGWKIGDLFYMYNLIVHKDSFGQRSMTRIFEDMATSSRSSLVNSFNQWLSEQDANPGQNTLSYDLRDLQFRIQENVPTSSIKSDVGGKNKPDFTFVFPTLTKVRALAEEHERMKTEEYRIASAAAKTATLFNILKETNGAVLLTQEDYSTEEMGWRAEEAGVDAKGLIEIMQFASTKKAFVYGGKIFINTWLADITDHLHEWTHILLANMKWNKNEAVRNAYYQMVSSVVNDPNFESIAKNYRIDGRDMLHGSDMQEEVFAHLFQMYLKNSIFNDDTCFDHLISASSLDENAFGKFTKQVLAGFTGNDSLLVDAIESIDDDFGTDFIWQTHQKVSALKTKLVNDNELTVKCD